AAGACGSTEPLWRNRGGSCASLAQTVSRNYLVGPMLPVLVLESVDSHAEPRKEEIDVTTVPRQSDALLEQIIVKDPSMLEVMESARKVARHKAAVLITGETGVGKELVARIIHEHSNRSAKPWVDLNCAALPQHLVESELFGYERGAFSGADWRSQACSRSPMEELCFW